jgi:hypothetical protein
MHKRAFSEVGADSPSDDHGQASHRQTTLNFGAPNFGAAPASGAPPANPKKQKLEDPKTLETRVPLISRPLNAIPVRKERS